MVKNKKLILFLVILFAVLYLIINAIISLPKNKKYERTIFLGSSTRVNVSNDIKVYNEDVELTKLDVKILFKDEFIDGYISTAQEETSGIVNTCYAYNDGGDYLILDSVLIAHTPDISIKVKDKNTNESENIEEVYRFANSQNISFSQDLILDYMEISNLDVDNDGKDEYIYSVGLVEDAEEYVSLVFMKKDDKYILIDREDSEYQGMPNHSLRFFNLIDFDNDGNYEFVVSKLMSEYGPDYYQLYKFNSNSFVSIE